MTRPAVLLLLPLLACAPETLGALEKHRDALFTGSVIAAGPPNSRLGSFVVACGDEFLAAGARGPLWYSGAFTPAPTTSLLAAIACEGQGAGPIPVVGTTSGSPGAWKYVAGAWASLGAQGTPALVMTPDQGMLAAHASKIVLESDGGVVAPFNATALAFHPTSTFVGNLVALDTGAQTVTTFQPLSYALQSVFSAPSGHVFANTLAVGQFHPGSAWQIALSTVSGQVLIMSPSGTLLMTLNGTTGSFGAALGVSPGYFPSIDGLYVGEPELDTVHLMIGDAGVELMSIDDGGSFGAALAVNRSGDLAVGAPLAGDGGLVFRQSRLAVFPVGEPTLCNAGELCRGPFGCTLGTCLGGIVCAGQVTGCFPGERCVSGMLDACVPIGDAGVIDAGTVVDAGRTDAGPGTDAGESMDAGQADAGSLDGGSFDAGPADAGGDAGAGPDAGEGLDGGRVDAGFTGDAGPQEADGGPDTGAVTFGTCGCSTGSALPGLMAALGVWARRGRPERGPARRLTSAA